MKILVVSSEHHSGNFSVSETLYNTIVVKGLKSQKGLKLGVILGLKIVSSYEKNVQDEQDTLKSQIEVAEYMATELGNKKRMEYFTKWIPVKTVALSDTDVNTVAEQKAINKQLDREHDIAYKKMLRDTAGQPKASEVLVKRIARFN